MARYRKKPIEVEAFQTDAMITIPTLEGYMTAEPGDWIITGVKGEQYPCKPDIFEATYEKVRGSRVMTDEEWGYIAEAEEDLKHLELLLFRYAKELREKLNDGDTVRIGDRDMSLWDCKQEIERLREKVEEFRGAINRGADRDMERYEEITALRECNKALGEQLLQTEKTRDCLRERLKGAEMNDVDWAWITSGYSEMTEGEQRLYHYAKALREEIKALREEIERLKKELGR